MSFKNLAHKFPRQTAGEIEFQITHNIREILRAHYRDFPSALKWLCVRTGVRLRTARNWYEGCNPPSSGHLLVLARAYPAVLKMILQLVGRADLATLCMLGKEEHDDVLESTPNGSEIRKEGAIFCTINVTTSLNIANKLNQRQLWFLGMLQQGYHVKPSHIKETWNVSLRTAKYDISSMTDLGLIKYVGFRGTGRYNTIL